MAAVATETAVPIMGKKMMKKMETMTNETVASGYSTFAMRQMEKMGWAEGKGLGKNEQGRKEHVKTKKREENLGLGAEETKENWGDQWWFNVYNKVASKVQVAASSDEETVSKKKKKKSKKRSRTDEGEDADDAESEKKKSKKEKKAKKEKKKSKSKDKTPKAAPTFEELFAATGGVRIGRRAYAPSKGKWAREELQTIHYDTTQGNKKISVDFLGTRKCTRGCTVTTGTICICFSSTETS